MSKGACYSLVHCKTMMEIQRYDLSYVHTHVHAHIGDKAPILQNDRNRKMVRFQVVVGSNGGLFHLSRGGGGGDCVSGRRATMKDRRPPHI